MIAKCSQVSTNFSNVQVGELLWCEGHVGIYIGGGLACECTPRWSGGVQITAVGNIAAKPGYNTRTWTKHGKLPYVSYSDFVSSSSKAPTSTKAEPAKAYSKAHSRSYTVSAGALNMRSGAGTTKAVICVLQKGDKVRCYGYFTSAGNTPWLLVQAADGTTGYCSSKYLK